MPAVGSIIGARNGRLGLLVGLVIALTALLSASASDAATARAKGLDVSNWNGAINWTKVASAGYRFAFGKATEGTAYTDKTYPTNRNGSEGAGLVFGAYHFARPAGSNWWTRLCLEGLTWVMFREMSGAQSAISTRSVAMVSPASAILLPRKRRQARA